MFFHGPIRGPLSHGVGFGIRRTGPNPGSTDDSPTGCLSLFTASELIAGRGIEGDRYFKGIGTYSPKPDVRDAGIAIRRTETRRFRRDRSLNMSSGSKAGGFGN